MILGEKISLRKFGDLFLFGYKRMPNLSRCSLNALGFPFLLFSEALFVHKELN